MLLTSLFKMDEGFNLIITGRHTLKLMLRWTITETTVPTGAEVHKNITNTNMFLLEVVDSI